MGISDGAASEGAFDVAPTAGAVVSPGAADELDSPGAAVVSVGSFGGGLFGMSGVVASSFGSTGGCFPVLPATGCSAGATGGARRSGGGSVGGILSTG